MLRELLIALGLFEVARPRRVIDACERIGLENPGVARLRPWGVTIARIEGLLVVWLLVRGREGSRLVRAVFGGAGTAVFLVPRPFIRATQVLAYDNTEDLELKPWVGPAARALGLLYLSVAALSTRAGHTTGDDRPKKQRDGR